MLDYQGRSIHYLRVSVTDRCNLRCRYCMPEGGAEWLPHGQILSYEQIVRITRLLVSLGIDKVRVTGGEPLVRKRLDHLIRALQNISGIRAVALTTNGLLLSEQISGLVDAGLTEVNVSLDTLDSKQYAEITRRDELSRALAGLEAALAVPELTVKINCVPIGENDNQLVPLAAMARDKKLLVRFIELMPIGLGVSLRYRTERQVLDKLEAAFGPALSIEENQENCGPARYVTFQDFQGKVGFISSLSHQFCASCNRVRLTSSGFLKTCLQYEDGVDLKALLDAGASDEILLKAMKTAILKKPLRHHFATPRMNGDEQNNMNLIGG